MTDDDLGSLDLGSLLVGSLWVLGFAMLALSIVLGLIAWALYQAGKRQLTAALVTALSLLAAGALLAYAIAGDARAEVIPLASLAIGALAATLGQLATDRADPDPDTPPEPPIQTDP
jgi:hypothetical protein